MVWIKGLNVPQVLKMEYLKRTFQKNPRVLGKNVVKEKSFKGLVASKIRKQGKSKRPIMILVIKFKMNQTNSIKIQQKALKVEA